MASNEHHHNFDVPGSGIMEAPNYIPNTSSLASGQGGNFHQLPRQRTTAEWEEINKKISELTAWMREHKKERSNG